VAVYLLLARAASFCPYRLCDRSIPLKRHMERTNRFVLSPPEKSIPSINHQQSGRARPCTFCSCVLPFCRSRASEGTQQRQLGRIGVQHTVIFFLLKNKKPVYQQYNSIVWSYFQFTRLVIVFPKTIRIKKSQSWLFFLGSQYKRELFVEFHIPL
jgi:hypothetical protein